MQPSSFTEPLVEPELLAAAWFKKQLSAPDRTKDSELFGGICVGVEETLRGPSCCQCDQVCRPSYRPPGPLWHLPCLAVPQVPVVSWFDDLKDTKLLNLFWRS
ncbi:hypothetical protein GN956_G25946 [Arapaima gigas]